MVTALKQAEREARDHKRASARHRRMAQEAAQRRDALIAQLEALGVPVERVQ